MNLEYPVFTASPGTVISLYGPLPGEGTICGYCRGLVLEYDRFRFCGGFRRYTDRGQRVSWAEPVHWPTAPHSQISIRIVPEKGWMQFRSRSEALRHSHLIP